MTIKAATIRPGLLVSVKSTVVGGVAYKRIDLDHDGLPAPEGTDVTRWETTRTIEDPAEHEAAIKARGAALTAIRKVCSATTFGLLCPTENEGALDAAIVTARAIVEAHNAQATHTRVSVYALKGRIASDDAEAARAITQEIAGLVAQMDRGIASFDPKAIRDAANEAREMSNMLGEAAKAKIDGAIEQAREAARMIVKRIEKEGEDRAVVLADIQRGQIESARIAFLDLDGTTEQSEALPSIEGQRFADLDLDEQSLPPLREAPKSATERQVIPTIDLATLPELS